MDIVVPCFHGKKEYFLNTQKCIEAIRTHTNMPYKLIVVENLAKLASDMADVYVSYNYPRTCAENVNTGLKLSESDYICVITNDVIVKDGYLEALLECFREPNCGIATLESSQFGRSAQNKIVEMFFGGIWFIPKKIQNEIGLWDETFRHAFDDADYWVRAYQQGYKIYMNKRVVVQHDVGARTIKDINPDFESIYNENRKRFNDKHSGCGLRIFEIQK